MTAKAWAGFTKEKKRFQSYVKRLTQELPELQSWQQQLVDTREGPDYRVDTPVVYNTALDDIDEDSEIKLIVVADNPGRREQALENRRYLIGPSGKIAAGFFSRYSELGIDFYKNVIVLNKTSVHTPRTNELAVLSKLGGAKMETVLKESQKEMADLLLAFHRCFAPLPVWIIGYSEMKKGGIFEEFTACLIDAYSSYPARKKEILFFRHFSMNQFTADFNKQRLKEENPEEALYRIGSSYRDMILNRYLTGIIK